MSSSHSQSQLLDNSLSPPSPPPTHPPPVAQMLEGSQTVASGPSEEIKYCSHFNLDMYLELGLRLFISISHSYSHSYSQSQLLDNSLSPPSPPPTHPPPVAQMLEGSQTVASGPPEWIKYCSQFNLDMYLELGLRLLISVSYSSSISYSQFQLLDNSLSLFEGNKTVGREHTSIYICL